MNEKCQTTVNNIYAIGDVNANCMLAHSASRQARLVINTIKVVSDLISSVDGKIIEVNAVLEAESWTINEEAQGKGWIAKIELDNKDQIKGLLSHEEYLSKLGLDE